MRGRGKNFLENRVKPSQSSKWTNCKLLIARANRYFQLHSSPFPIKTKINSEQKYLSICQNDGLTSQGRQGWMDISYFTTETERARYQMTSE